MSYVLDYISLNKKNISVLVSGLLLFIPLHFACVEQIVDYARLIPLSVLAIVIALLAIRFFLSVYYYSLYFAKYNNRLSYRNIFNILIEKDINKSALFLSSSSQTSLKNLINYEHLSALIFAFLCLNFSVFYIFFEVPYLESRFFIIALIVIMLVNVIYHWKIISSNWPNYQSFLVDIRLYSIFLLSKLMMPLALVLLIWSLFPEIPILYSFVAAVIISVVAIFPIAIRGLGVREVVAIVAFNYLAIPIDEAIAIVAPVSLFLILIPLLVQFIRARLVPDNYHNIQNLFDFSLNEVFVKKKIVAQVFLVLLASLLFFKDIAPIRVIDVFLTISFADILAGLSFLAIFIFIIRKASLPVWRLPCFNLILVLLTALLLVGFINGWLKFGIYPWSLMGRLVGWGIILGYLFSGYFIARYLGEEGVRRCIEIMILVSVVIILIHVWKLNVTWEWGDSIRFYRPFHVNPGYSVDRNAYSFELALLIAYLAANEKFYADNIASSKRTILKYSYIFAIIILLAAIFFTHSRTGLGMAIILIFLGLVFRRIGLDRIVTMTALLLIPISILYMPSWGTPIVNKTAQILKLEQTDMKKVTQRDIRKDLNLVLGNVIFNFIETRRGGGKNSSNNRRLYEYRVGFDAWKSAPILGLGLGGFGVYVGDGVKKTDRVHTARIHNVFVETLVDFGLVGVLIQLGTFITLMIFLWKWKSDNPLRWTLFFVLIGFAMAGMVHSMYYQRIFWLMLGLTLALPIISSTDKNKSMSKGSIT